MTVGSITRRGRAKGDRKVDTDACSPPPDGEGTLRGAKDVDIPEAGVVEVGDKGGESIGLLLVHGKDVGADQGASAGRTSIVTRAREGLNEFRDGGRIELGEVPSSSE